MKTINEYAKEKNVSYEAVRRQIKRYSEELKGHIIKKNHIQFLDTYSCEFLDKKRKNNSVVVFETSKDERIEFLEKENKNLLVKIVNLQNELLQEKDEVKKLQEEKMLLIDNKATQKKKSWLKFWKKD